VLMSLRRAGRSARALTERAMFRRLGVGHLILDALPSKVGSPVDVLFLPYDSVDCVLQHLAAAKAIEDFGLSARVLIPARSMSSMREGDPRMRDQALNYDDRILQLYDVAEGDPDLARGFIDQYRRTCEVDAFFDNRALEPHLLGTLIIARSLAEASVERATTLVVPDLAYAFNRCIASFSRQASRSLHLLNPHGRFRRVDLTGDFAYEEPWFGTSSLSFENMITPEAQRAADQFIADRRSGVGLSDWNLNLANSMDPRSDEDSIGKNVVFMHCIRDAEQVPVTFDEDAWIFSPDLFCWTRSVMRRAVLDPEKWALRAHPAAGHYPGEREIVERLSRVTGLTSGQCSTDVSREWVLSNKIPVLTHSGSIALECAIEGFKSVTTSSLLPGSLTVHLGSPGRPFTSINDPFSATVPVSEVDSALARLLLTRTYAPDLPEPLRLSHPVQPQSSRSRFMLSQARSIRGAQSTYFGQRSLFAWKMVTRALGFY
jgi:hypothetical protein